MKLIVDDDDGPREVELERRVSTIGSAADCQIPVRARDVALHHAVVYLDVEGYRIGTRGDHPVLVQGQPAKGQLLRGGDRVVVGDATLTVLDELPAAAAEEQSELQQVADALILQLATFSQSVLAQEEWPRPAELLLESLLRAVGAEHGFLLLFDGDSARVVAANPSLDQLGDDLLLSDSIVQQVLRTGEPVVLDDAAASPDFGAVQSVVQLRLASVMCVPLHVGSTLRGALYVGHRGRCGLFGGRAQAIARIFCAQGVLLLENARYIESLRAKVWDLHHRLEHAGQRELIGESPQMERVLQTLRRAAPTDISLLITGETGTGKELTARFLHDASRRASGPFVAVNCAAIPEELLESELFGHARGAFTGAQRDREGLVESAAGGSLFLDEVGELPLKLQPKLLRVLQERSFRRVGDPRDRPLEARIIAATNRDLLDAPSFRPDLYYRLAELVVEVPPLRERGGDLTLLVKFFLRRFASELERGATRLSRAAWSTVQGHPWPGNVRELRNRLRRAVLMCDEPEIGPEDLGFGPTEGSRFEPLAEARDRFVLQHVQRALEQTGGDRDQAAALLGISVRSLYRYLNPRGQD